MTIEVRQFADALVESDPKITSLALGQMLNVAGYPWVLITQTTPELQKYFGEQTGYWGYYIMPAAEFRQWETPSSASVVFFNDAAAVTAFRFHFSLTLS